jgi:hypothetical protein
MRSTAHANKEQSERCLPGLWTAHRPGSRPWWRRGLECLRCRGRGWSVPRGRPGKATPRTAASPTLDRTPSGPSAPCPEMTKPETQFKFPDLKFLKSDLKLRQIRRIRIQI